MRPTNFPGANMRPTNLPGTNMRPTNLPGTTIETVITRGAADRQLTPMFLCGGLVLSQICQLTGLEGHTIQNWVKRKFISPPIKKKYNRNQVCRIFNINLLKDTFTLEQAVTLLGYVNTNINGSDSGGSSHSGGSNVIQNDIDSDRIDDSRLYTYLVDCLAALNCSDITDSSDSFNNSDNSNSVDIGGIGDSVQTVTAEYQSRHRDAAILLRLVLEIMLTACQAQQVHRRALDMFGRLRNM